VARSGPCGAELGSDPKSATALGGFWRSFVDAGGLAFVANQDFFEWGWDKRAGVDVPSLQKYATVGG